MSSACPFHPLLLAYQERPLLTYTVSVPSCPSAASSAASSAKLTICTRSLVLITQTSDIPFLPSPDPANKIKITSNLIKFPYSNISSLKSTPTGSSSSSNSTLTLSDITSYLILHPPNAGLSQPVLPHKIVKLSTPFSLSITFAHTDISSDTPLYKSLVQLYKGEVKTEEEEQDNILTRAPEKPTEDVISSKIHRSVTETKLNEVLPVR